MKIIDLLNKIANGEEVPNKIKWNNFVWCLDKLEEGDYFKIREDGMFDWLFGDYLHGSLISTLDDKVEVIEDNNKIEEDKKIEKIPDTYDNDDMYASYWGKDTKILQEKINEIIEVLNDKD